jgi:ribonucleoside-diphosphate reductase alpha chain
LPDMPFETDFAQAIYEKRYKHPKDRNWAGTAARVVHFPFEALREQAPAEFLWDARERITRMVERREFMPGGRYLYAAGRDFHQVNNCVLLRCEDSREGWAELSYRAEMALMTGAGIGVWYGDVRPSGQPIARTGGTASGPLPKMGQINDTGRHVMQGGNRRSAIWAGLPWWHSDVFDFITCKDWSDEVKALKEKDWNFPAPMDTTNISVTLDDEFFEAYTGNIAPERSDWLNGPAPDGGSWSAWARRVYTTAVAHMLKHGEPGFTVDRGDKRDEVLRNACTEITSADDSDVCNLGSLVLPRFSNPEQFGAAVRDAVLYLTAGSLYSHVPYEKVAEVRDSNRRLGLGLIGVHEMCMKHGVRYGSPESFEVLLPYMEQYARALEYAHDWQDRLGLSRSKGATAIAPNGTIGIIAESTPSADPIFAAAEAREVRHAHARGDNFEQHIVVDPVAARQLRAGTDPSVIEDAYTLAEDPQRRLAMTAFLQGYTDHAISGTVNLPEPVTNQFEVELLGSELMGYLPRLRGITFYPDGARSGQPRTRVDLQWALEQNGVVIEAEEERCAGGVCSL